MSERFKKVDFYGVEVLDVDFSYSTEEENIYLMEQIVNYSLFNYPERFYCMVNAKKSIYTSRTIEIAKKNFMKTEHINSVSVLYNANQIYKTMMRVLTVFTNKKVECFGTREEAVVFLSQKIMMSKKVS